MAKPTSQSAAALAILMLAVATLAVAQAPPPPQRSGQERHLFQVTVREVDGAVEDDYNYNLLGTVLGGYEAARGVMFETEPLRFSAYLTNNQARRLSRVKGVLGVRQRDDPVPRAKH
ncbi:hypothetical protein CFC21_112771 [Triticum aestivum]|uniref:Uncharacterized protein n=3 Tax=Triticinae TaxID=1648030 RepID=A0A9R0G5H1_WHEAT|nr:hypothetical protein CFC21_031559 [Triticum aestivum]KAF7018262.1 hypothetical protein CFC21_031563 [Triticum aestivum]MBC2899954.1 hypothetical protein [Triticum aestivum]